jgi:subtilisin family serine protease
MIVRTWRFVLAGAVALGALTGTAQAAGPGRFVAVNPQEFAGVSKLPPGLDTTPVTVVVLLGGDPVAVVREAAGRRLSRDEKDGIKTQRRVEQAAVLSQIQAAGGTVVGSFQSAINGIKVQIPFNKVGALRQIAGVTGVKGVNTYERDNVLGVPRVQAPSVWAGLPGFRGEGVKIAVIDTGIDYTHANFGGPGTVAAFNAAAAASALSADPSLFGPAAPRVKGGIDLAGDAYDANVATSVPQPDPNPLDCIHAGHGSHVAGTAAGSGVTSAGTTYTGPYDLSTSSKSFRIGPGVAPKADIYSIRVFGCAGSTNLVVEALDWAVDHDMDVVNMSLGSAYGTSDSADALASDNAVKAGVVVVASAGNSNDLRYITGAPASSSRSISVAATTTPATIDFGNLALPAVATDIARTVTAINANGAAYANPLTGVVKVVRDATKAGGISLGCSVAEFNTNGGVAGKIAVVQRGVCARVAKAVFGQQAGAIAVVMVNNTTALPPYEGIIFQNPDDGAYYDVTIPFFGVKGIVTSATSDGSRLILRDGLSTSITVGTPQTSGIATFSSGGPRNGDSVLKPDVAAPGSPTISTAVGTGNLQASMSGTSMASPHVAGVAALVVQAHPRWKPGQIKSAIVNSGDPSAIAGYLTHSAGTGFVNAASAAHTDVIAFADDKLTSMSFGLAEFRNDYRNTRSIKLHNDGHGDATFNVAALLPQGSPHTITLDRTKVRVRAHDDAEIHVTITVPAATAGNSDLFRDVAGLITFTPATGADNGGIALRVPYYLVPRVSSNVEAALTSTVKAKNPTGTIKLTNKGSAIPATADFYTWGLAGKGKGSDPWNSVINLSAAGVQSFADGSLVFAVTTEESWSSPSTREFDFLVDVNGDGVADFDVVGVDYGLVNGTNAFDGRMVVAIFDLNLGGGWIENYASASTDGSTMLLPVLASSLGLDATLNPRFSYTAIGYDLVETGASDQFTNWAKYNAFSSAITDGQYVGLAPNASSVVPFSVNLTELAATPALGLMVVTQDNKNGKDEANLVRIDVKP